MKNEIDELFDEVEHDGLGALAIERRIQKRQAAENCLPKIKKRS
jgi:hypothetical protein